MLESPYSKLCSFRLRGQHDYHTHREYRGFDTRPLASALRTNQTLTSLDLAYDTLRPEQLAPNHHAEYIRSDTALLASALRTNQTLKVLNLSYNPHAALALARRENDVLRCLRLDYTLSDTCSVGPNGAKK
jgi:phosphohistidine phosphatase SixA